KLEAFRVDGDAVMATLATVQGTQTLRTRLLVGADGTNSFVRAALGIDSESRDYAQTAFVTTITSERAIDSAYERFTATGPVAMLPLTQGRVGVVLTVPTSDAAGVAALDDPGFIELLHERFGWRLGKLRKPGKRVSYPLRRLYAQRIVAPRTVLAGNAAQTLHPIGAQGFNLGLRDALTLAELLIDNNRDAGDAALLADYAQRRREDREGTAAQSDALARWTANESPPLKLLRTFGLLALDRIAPLQAAMVNRGMGFRGRVPKLALNKSS
ncbi:MAG: FAD-dependent monooxygenase, partial [Proteobacteria bacterium]|nr:FAD-dependent monooxygenase [Pseudomonadota bacterium]